MKIGVIGAGNLGTALVKGLIESEKFHIDDFILSRRTVYKLDSLKKQGFNVTCNNIEAIEQSDVVILAVLPQKFDEVITEISPFLQEKHIVVSLVSGVEISSIQQNINSSIPIVRAMPNTAIAIRESMTCIATVNEFQDYIPVVRSVFDEVGETILIKEEQMTSATALCACGIAFFLRAIRAASQGGIEIDFHAAEALKMAAQTAKGAASLLLKNNTHPEDEIDKVTSPKGCTIGRFKSDGT